MPTLKDVAALLGLSSERKMAAKLNIQVPVSTLALIKAYEHTPPIARIFAQIEPNQSEFVPQTYQFGDQSVGYITSRKWDFGDSTTSTEKNPKHTYTQPSCPKFFTVELTVGNAGGSNSATAQYDVPPLPPVARFTPNPASGPAPLTVHFENHTSGDCMLVWSWDFGDGSTADGIISPTHTYGSHSTTQGFEAKVSMGCSNRSGVGNAFATIQVGAGPPPPQPTTPVIIASLYQSGTIQVQGSKFPANVPVYILEVDLTGNRSPLYTTQSNSLGTFTQLINVQGCTGGTGNPLKVVATADGHLFSDPATVSC
jgi:PKD repeat protein